MDCNKCPIFTSRKKDEYAPICSMCGQYDHRTPMEKPEGEKQPGLQVWAYKSMIGQPEAIKKADLKTDTAKLAEDHWGYVASVLKSHGEADDVIEKCGHHYKTAFIHGYKHAKEAV